MTLSETLFERAKKVAPGGVHSPVRAFKGVGGVPPFIQSAKGAELTDVDGKRYLDFCMSWGPLLFGHQDSEILENVSEALHRGWSYGTAEPYSLELAEFMTQKIQGLEKVRFVNSGTEAVMSALRIARAATGRRFILKFEGCYHGHGDSMLVKAGSGLAEMASPDSAGVSSEVAKETLVLPLDQPQALEALFQEKGSEIAAVILEPLPANNGLLPQTEMFFKTLSNLTKKHGSLLIFDEVISGFRVSFGGMAEKLGITPDLFTYGKVIGGGFPVGAYGGRADLMDWVAPIGPVYQAGTLSANPVAMVAGISMLKKLDREKPYAQLEETNQKLGNELKNLFSRFPKFDFQLQSEASLFWLACGKGDSPDIIRSLSHIPAQQKERFAPLFHGLLKRGVYLAPSGFEVGFLSTAHTSAHLDQFLTAFEETLKELNA